MKKYTSYLLLLTFIFGSVQIYAQFDSVKYDKEAFLLGALNNYYGPEKTFDNKDKNYFQLVDIVHKNNYAYAIFIKSLFQSEYPDIRIENNGAPMGIRIYSSTLSSIIDKYYSWQPSGSYTIFSDTIYIGKLRSEKIKTEYQKKSFLLGAILNYSVTEERVNLFTTTLKKEKLMKDSTKNYKHLLSMPNSPMKAKTCVDILKELGCEDVEYMVRDAIPVGHFVSFNSSDKIKEILEDAFALKKHLAETHLTKQ